MNKRLAISAIALIAAIMIVGTVSPTVFADKPEEKKNNGNNGCEKANPNSKACEKNPNTTPVEELTCQDCVDTYWDSIDACGEDYDCRSAAYAIVTECFEKMLESTGEHCSFDDRGR